MQKRCPRCSAVKDVGEFHRNSSRHDGYQGSCKECQRAYVKRHYIENRLYYLDKARARNVVEKAKLRALIWELKDLPCADCGKRYRPWVMQFDHVRGKKLFDVARGIESTSKRILEEAAKCDVVCANCHAQRTHERRMRARSSVD